MIREADNCCAHCYGANGGSHGRPVLGQQQRQEGLVNLALGDVTVQVPVAVAANICDVSVNVVAENTEPGGTTTCEALAEAAAQN